MSKGCLFAVITMIGAPSFGFHFDIAGPGPDEQFIASLSLRADNENGVENPRIRES